MQRLLLSTFAFLFFGCIRVAFSDPVVGDQVVVKATKPLGVPVHQEARSSLFARATDGSQGTVMELAENGRWIHVNFDNGINGWIITKYVDAVIGHSPVPIALDTGSSAVWASPAGCERVRLQGRTLPKSADSLRIATWNIRWFPYGDKEINKPEKHTDIPWLACTLTWLDADVIAIQEIRTESFAVDAMDSLLDQLTANTGSDWHVDLQECGSGGHQHVGFLWNADKVSLSDAQDQWEFNGAATAATNPCMNRLRPGRYAYVSGTNGGVDFHLVSVHSDSGTSQRDLDNRVRVLNRLDTTTEPLLARDTDVVIAGDFNTMGASGKSADDEISEMTAMLQNENPGFAHPAVMPACSEYFRGKGGLLDHIVMTQDMEEANGVSVAVSGYCAEFNCDRMDDSDFNEMPLAYQKLSDHCPVYMDINSSDQD